VPGGGRSGGGRLGLYPEMHPARLPPRPGRRLSAAGHGGPGHHGPRPGRLRAPVPPPRAPGRSPAARRAGHRPWALTGRDGRLHRPDRPGRRTGLGRAGRPVRRRGGHAGPGRDAALAARRRRPAAGPPRPARRRGAGPAGHPGRQRHRRPLHLRGGASIPGRPRNALRPAARGARQRRLRADHALPRGAPGDAGGRGRQRGGQRRLGRRPPPRRRDDRHRAPRRPHRRGGRSGGRRGGGGRGIQGPPGGHRRAPPRADRPVGRSRRLPAASLAQLLRYRRGLGTFKLDWGYNHVPTRPPATSTADRSPSTSNCCSTRGWTGGAGAPRSRACTWPAPPCPQAPAYMVAAATWPPARPWPTSTAPPSWPWPLPPEPPAWRSWQPPTSAVTERRVAVAAQRPQATQSRPGRGERRLPRMESWAAPL
jgi:hypothetical protein